MLKKHITVLIYLFTLHTFSQNAKIDSLLTLINERKNSIEIYRQLSNEYENINTNKSIFYSKQALNLSQIQNSANEISISQRDLGEIYFMANKIDSAIVFLSKSIEISHSNELFIYRVYVDLANCYSQKRDMNKTKEFIDKAIEVDKSINSSDNNYLNKKLRLNLIKSQYYQNINEYEKAFESAYIALELSKKIKDKKREFRIMNTIANIYDSKGDRKKAIEIYKDLLNKVKIGDDTKSNISVWYYNLANTLIKIDDYKGSKYYIDKGLKIIETEQNDKMNAFFSLAKAQIQTKEADFDNALISIDIAENNFTRNGITVRIADCNYYRSKVYIEKKDYKKATEYILKSANSYEKNGLKQELKDCYSILSEIKVKQKNYEEALFYTKKYNETNDLIFSENKINAISNAEIKYETYLKELQIKTQQLQIQKEKANKNKALTGIAFILLLGFGGFWFFRNKQKQTNLKTQNTLLSLQQNLIESELSNLNKQLDPHEIKNLLASISPEIQEKAPESYKKMLKLFNLTKASLNSNSITATIENQLQQIDDLLSLEKSMLPFPLEYSIKNTIQNTQIEIPRLLLKNLVENAIKHGIKQQEKGGTINVNINQNDNFVFISVDDTGIGRKQAISLDSGIGTTTYQKLFATLNSKNKENATFEIIDKQQGTKVEIQIPINYKYS